MHFGSHFYQKATYIHLHSKVIRLHFISSSLSLVCMKFWKRYLAFPKFEQWRRVCPWV